MKKEKMFFGIPENLKNEKIFYLINFILLVTIEISFRYLNSSSVVSSYKGNTYSSIWNVWIILFLVTLIYLGIKKNYKTVLEFIFLMFFILNRTIVFKTLLHIFFLLLEVAIFSRFVDNYATNGGFETTSMVIYALGQFYLYIQFYYLSKQKVLPYFTREKAEK